jgi:hypothetical protein
LFVAVLSDIDSTRTRLGSCNIEEATHCVRLAHSTAEPGMKGAERMLEETTARVVEEVRSKRVREREK